MNRTESNIIQKKTAHSVMLAYLYKKLPIPKSQGKHPFGKGSCPTC